MVRLDAIGRDHDKNGNYNSEIVNQRVKGVKREERLLVGGRLDVGNDGRYEGNEPCQLRTKQRLSTR